MKRFKILKSFSFSLWAVVMCILAVFAFMPMTANASITLNDKVIETQDEVTTTSGLGLDPKNDPVVYTTESGLEIRMSNATQYTGTTNFTNNRGSSVTQNISNFFYFTMGKFSATIYTGAGGSKTANYTVSNADVNWIILGLGKNTSYFLDKVVETLFSTWKTNTNGLDPQYSTAIGGPYFFKEIFESTCRKCNQWCGTSKRLYHGKGKTCNY